MNYGIAVFPDKEVQHFANNYRKRYDPHYSLIPPHLTIREAEQWTEGKLEAAVAHLERATRQIAPFAVRFNRFSTFFPVSNVIYMALEDPEPFRLMRDQICRDVLEQQLMFYTYTPHLTVGQQMSSDELHDVFAHLRKMDIDFTTPVDCVHLLRQNENNVWKVLKTFFLRG